MSNDGIPILRNAMDRDELTIQVPEDRAQYLIDGSTRLSFQIFSDWSAEIPSRTARLNSHVGAVSKRGSAIRVSCPASRGHLGANSWDATYSRCL